VELLTIVLLGFFLGMKHATDADHVIAVTTIVSRQRSIAGAALVGMLWGVGHTVTILAVGGAIVVFGVVIPPRVGLGMEFGVALMLIVLGALALAAPLRRLRGAPADHHSHPHAHGDYVHSHPHGHSTATHGHAENGTPQARLDRWLGGLGLYQATRPVVVGLVHGLAGSAAVALLVLATIRDARWAITYLLVFGLGTIAGMALVTLAVALPFRFAAGRSAAFHRVLATVAGVLSLVFGLALAYQIGVVDGLFGAAPRWSPE
jgi:high-affinity nickel-transport protein